MLQFYSRDGPVVLNDAGNVEDRKAQWFYCLTDKPMALSMESGEKMLKTHIDDAGKLMLEYEDGETFNPRDVIRAYYSA